MENKWVQFKFGECAFVCLANAFNEKKFIDEIKNHDIDKGIDWVFTRKLLEKITVDFSTHHLLHSKVPVKNYVPIFENLDVKFDKKELNDYYNMFLFTIISEKENYHHCVLGLKQNNKNFIHVLDPNYLKSEVVQIKDFFDKYDCCEVEIFIDSKKKEVMFFGFDFLKHLFEKCPNCGESLNVIYNQQGEVLDKLCGDCGDCEWKG